jgi:hypothetical protein
MNKKTKGSLIAAAVAGIFMGGAACTQQSGQAPVTAEMGYCIQKSSCAGKGDCSCKKGEPFCEGEHGCAGKNSCAGKGWVYMKKGDEKMMMNQSECEKTPDAVFKKKS